MAATYRYEWATQVVEDDGSATGLGKRLSYFGLKGGFGHVTIGRQINPFYGLTGTSYALGNEYTGNYAMYEIGNFSDKTSDTLVYSNTWGDFEFGTAFELNQDDAALEDLDSFSLAGRYNFDWGRISLAYWDQKTSDLTPDGGLTQNDADVGAAFIDFNVGEGGLVYLGWMGAAEQASDGGSFGGDFEFGDNDVDSYHIGYNGRTGDHGYFLSYDKIDFASEADFDKDVWTAGYAFYLSSRTRIYFEAEFLSSDAVDANRNKQVIGLRHDF